MSQPSTIQKLKQTETEVAVLQAQYTFITEKVDDIKTSLQDLRNHIDDHMENTNELIKDFQEENKKEHKEVNKKIAALEKWRWMLMGAGVIAGALGFPVIEKLIIM